MAERTIRRTSLQDHAPIYTIPLDLRSPGLLAKWPIIGVIMFLFGGLAFGALYYNLMVQGPLFKWDIALAKILPGIGSKSPGFVKYIMDGGFYLGKEVVSVLTFFHSIYFLYKRYYQELAMMLSGVMGGTVLFWFLSHLIDRQRPTDQLWIIVKLPGFPSGHAIVAVAFFGLLAYLLAPKMPSTFWKAFVIAAAILIIGFIGFTRIFTGGHYLTDILSGYAVGIAWCGFIFTLIEIYAQKRRSRYVKQN